MLQGEKAAGNPVAGLVHSLQLESNHITLMLANHLDTDEYEDAEPLKACPPTSPSMHCQSVI